MFQHSLPHVAGLRAELAGNAFALAAIRLGLLRKAHFNPAQLRIPTGQPGGGQWTDGADSSSVIRVSRIGRGSVPVRINGRLLEATPAQAARLALSNQRAQDALRQVRERDPSWRPTPSLAETVEGQIQSNEALAREAEARLQHLQRVGIGPGHFAGESIPARGPERDFTPGERREINRIGSETGCHTCGIREPGTGSRNFVPDHQMPNALNTPGKHQRLYPQCLTCSRRQGGWISGR